MSSNFLFQLGLDLAHSVFWGRVHFSAPGGFCVAWWRNGHSHDPLLLLVLEAQVNALPDASWMSERLSIFEAKFMREIDIFSVENWIFYNKFNNKLSPIWCSHEVIECISTTGCHDVLISSCHATRWTLLHPHQAISQTRVPWAANGHVQQNRIKKMQQVCLCSNMICITFLVDSTPSVPFGTWKHHEWSQFARRVCPPCTARWLFGCCKGPS